MHIEKGIILAGGTGSRLYPLTIASNKQLLPIYDKPVIYYPLTTLMLAGVKKFLIICNTHDMLNNQKLLKDGSQWGVEIFYAIQNEPRGLPDAFIVGEKFIEDDSVAMILGDNFFHGDKLSGLVHQEAKTFSGAHMFLYKVNDASRYGVAILDKNGTVIDLEEKPKTPVSDLAITGLYYFDKTVSARAQKLKPSGRGELEITDLLRDYLNEGKLDKSILGRGQVWLDVGSPESLLNASNYVEVIQSRQGVMIASPEEVAWRMGYLTDAEISQLVRGLPNGYYKTYLHKLLS